MKAKHIILVSLFFTAVSCTKKFEETNTDPDRVDRISPGTLLNPIIYAVTSFNMDRADAISFNLMQVALPFPSAQGGLHRYDVSENAGASTWNNYYRWLLNIKEMRQASIDAEDPNYEAIALTLNAWVYSNLTDVFGDVPMTEAGSGEDGILQPKFDRQEDIYAKILADLETANTLFNTSRAMVYGTDLLFNNSVSKWRKFCNSLHLRLLLRVSNKPEMDAFTKMANMLDNPAQYPLFANNSESAILQISGVPPLVSPWGRAIDFGLFRAAAEFFVDNLNDFNDPRRPLFMTEARASDGTTLIGYKGIPSGYAGSESQFTFIPSNVNNQVITAPMIAPIMTFAELQFIKAELVQRGKWTGDAQAFYESGVQAAIEQWGATMPADYFTNPLAAYDGTLERIMLQKYYALYFVDYQQWFEYRRTGLPVLPTSDGMQNNKEVPVRLPFPVDVRTFNRTNYDAAVQSMGPDDINTLVWWDQ